VRKNQYITINVGQIPQTHLKGESRENRGTKTKFLFARLKLAYPPGLEPVGTGGPPGGGPKGGPYLSIKESVTCKTNNEFTDELGGHPTTKLVVSNMKAITHSPGRTGPWRRRPWRRRISKNARISESFVRGTERGTHPP